VFAWKTDREFEFDNWRKLDTLMLITMGLLMLELHDTYMGEGKAIDWIDPELFNALLHSF